MSRSLRVLLESLIDYAGLFPPAKLPMDEAVRNYLRYRESEHSFALGRFVVPAAKMDEVPRNVPLSVLADVGAFPPREQTLEVKASTAEEIRRIDAGGRTIYVELTDVSLLPLLKERGLRAKIRTGGVTADAFPPAGFVATFLRGCRDAGVAFKATAGLHHPLRCVKPLTYEPDAPTGTMHGFVNVFLAAALLDHAEEILRDDDASSFAWDDKGVSWRGHQVPVDELARVRRGFAISFGSCSFEEPIADLRELGWL